MIKMVINKRLKKKSASLVNWRSRVRLPAESFSRVAQWKRSVPIIKRSVDRNYALLIFDIIFVGLIFWGFLVPLENFSLI